MEAVAPPNRPDRPTWTQPTNWANWAGKVRCEPRAMAVPGNEPALLDALADARDASMRVRVAGSGHSFTPLVATDGLLLSLRAWHGIESHDTERRQVTLRGGSVLHALGDPLLALGLAFENLGDIDVQALAGALATGTHGTGRSLGNLSSRVVALRLATAEGELLEIDSEAASAPETQELLRAARVSLGALGVTSAVRLQLVEAYRLHEVTRRLPVDACLESLADEVAGHRHFEFFWYPSIDRAETKTLDPTEEPASELPDRKYERIGWAPHVIPSARDLRFVEMEYAVPEAAGAACFEALRARIRSRHPDLEWPVEYRHVAPDDAFLSPACERPTVTLSVHQDAALEHRALFEDLEPILVEAGGRPHWGKWHSLSARELAERYPHWERFQRVRERLDPRGRFVNEHLRRVLGV